MKTLEERKNDFISKAMKIHVGENLDYSQVVYKDNRTPVKIIDHDLRSDGTEYGVFWQTPSNHLKGQTHPDKRKERISVSKQLSQEEVIKRFKKIHKGENLDYSQVVYKGMHVPVKIISHELRPDGTEYGVFWQEPCVHLKGCSHPDIARDRKSKTQTYTTEEFIKKAKIVHSDDPYTYEKVTYVNSRTKVLINCHKKDYKGNEHGFFLTTPDNFLLGKGCPKCGNLLSHGENEIIEYIKKLLPNMEVIQRERTILSGGELDIYIPYYKIAFEFDGIQWHSERFGKGRYYHLHKTEKCNEKGITLFHIFEDEFIYHKQALFSKIKRILKKDDSPKIGARKCSIAMLTKEEAEIFLNTYHIQGYGRSTIYIGLLYKKEIVSVMSFTKDGNDKWNLSRFASCDKYIIQGAASKLFHNFVTKCNPYEVKTFLDRRWVYNSDNNVYIKCGFKKDGIVLPDYRYTNGHGQRIHKFNFRKQRLHKKHDFPLTMTENEMSKKLGYYKIWDCGLIRYIYKNPNYLLINN